MVLGNTLNILRPPERSTPPIQTSWNDDLVKNMHDVLGRISQQITAILNLKLTVILFQDKTIRGTAADTAETDLASYTLPANKFAKDDDAIRITAYGTTAATATTKRLRLYFGSVAVIDTTAQTDNDGNWRIAALIHRLGANSQGAYGNYEMHNVPALNSLWSALTETDTSDIVIKITGLNGTANANDIVQRGMTIEFLPAV